MKTTITCFLLLVFLSPALMGNVRVRIKNASRIKGMESYFLTGFGIVVGLNGSGDSDSELTQHTLANVLKHMQIDVDESQLKSSNCAAVSITARVRAGSHKGDMANAIISTIGDATSLQGGTLIMSPVLGTNGKLSAIAQGPLLVGGFAFGETGGGGESVVKNIPTVATLVKGLKLETDIGSNAYIYKDIITFLLKNPDFSNAFNMTTTINDKFVGTATAEDEGTIHVKIPKSYDSQNKIVEFINKIQQMEFDSDTAARIVLNEKTGTIIISGEVKISEVVITHSNISVNIKSALNVSQPGADSGGDTTVTEQQTTDVSEDKARLHHIPTTTNVGDLQEALNKLGVTPRDMMSIFQTLSDAGALHAELINQ